MHVGLQGHRAKPQDKKISVKSLVEQFLIGGFLVMIVSVLASHVSTKVAALIYALPLTYIPVVLYIHDHAREERCPQILSEYTGQNAASMILQLLFSVALYTMIKAHHRSNGTKIHLSGVKLAAYVFLGLCLMAVPAAFYYYWVCSGTCAHGRGYTSENQPCYFGPPMTS